MSFLSYNKIIPLIVLTLLSLNALLAHAEGGMSGGGGDAATEMRIDEIRLDILKWVTAHGAQRLILPSAFGYEHYVGEMTKILTPHVVVIGAVTSAEEAATQDVELHVSVDGQPKACRGFLSVKDGLPHILCNVERFSATNESDQYRLIHHEYAGLAAIEQNMGASSDYQISNQLTACLTKQRILKLAVLPTAMAKPEALLAGVSSYRLVEAVSDTANRPCPEFFRMGVFVDRVVIDHNTFNVVPRKLNDIDFGFLVQWPGEGSQGLRTDLFESSVGRNTINLNMRTSLFKNSGSDGFTRAFNRDRLVLTESYFLSLERKTHLLTVTHTRGGKKTETSVCTFQRETSIVQSEELKEFMHVATKDRSGAPLTVDSLLRK